jgi:hypothetical protein
MRPLSSVERFFERLVERPTARLFRAQLKPVQVLRRIERAMEAGRVSDAGRSQVPDRITVRVNPEDLPALEPLGEVSADLASRALAFARAHSFSLLDRPRVAIHEDDRVPKGEVDVEARFGGGEQAMDGGDGVSAVPGASATAVFQVPVAAVPRASLQVDEPDGRRRTIRVSARRITIGRAAECDLVLRDPRVSRRHARLQPRNGLLILTDLDSTNGTRVNGERIREVVLGIGDRIEVGGTEILVGSDAHPVGGEGSAGAQGA